MNTNLPSKWGEYAHLQAKLDQLNRVDSYSFGVEAAMDRAIEAAQDSQPQSPEEIQREADTAARRERQRAFIRAKYEGEIPTLPTNLIHALEARDTLRALQKRLSQSDWKLLYGVAQGYSAEEVSQQLALTPANVRVRTSRLRAHLSDTSWAA
jgi:ATP/maltotriose-dependent transcriptional regulator MalT